VIFLRCEQKEEERRLDELMKQAALDKESALANDEQAALEKEEQKKRDLMAALQNQLDEHEAMKFLTKEQQEVENKEIRKIWESWEVEEMQKRAAEREKKEKLAVELIQDQMDHVERARKEKEMDKQLDQMVKLKSFPERRLSLKKILITN